METFVTFKVSIVLFLHMSESETKDRILSRSRDLFMQYGIRSVSMDDIASEMGISKKTIYQYFADKEELVLAVINCKIDEAEAHCNFDRSMSINAIDEVCKSMEMVENMFRTMNPSVLLDLKKYHPKAYDRFLKHKNDYIFNTMRSNLLRGIEEGLYRPELHPDVIARFRIESILTPLDPVFYTGNKLTIADVEQEITIHYLFGIVTLKGYRLVLKYLEKKQKTKNN